MSLNQQVIAEFSPCTPSAPQLRDLSIQTSRPSDDERVSQDRRLSYSGSSATCVSTLIPRHHVAEDECFLQVQFRQPCNSTHAFAPEIIPD